MNYVTCGSIRRKENEMASISTNQIKFIKSLSDKKNRDKYGIFVVEGEKMVAEAVKSGFEIEDIFRIEDIGENAMGRISSCSSPSPALALVRRPSTMSGAGKICDKGLYLVLDGIRDPGNMGTIIRMADWFGLQGVYASGDSVDIFNPKVVQATMGAIFRVDFHYTDLVSLCASAKEDGHKVYGTFLDGGNIYSSCLDNGEKSPVLVVVGNESRGISLQVAGQVTDRIRIPSYPPGRTGSESLNAAVAASITIAEFRRTQTTTI